MKTNALLFLLIVGFTQSWYAQQSNSFVVEYRGRMLYTAYFSDKVEIEVLNRKNNYLQKSEKIKRLVGI